MKLAAAPGVLMLTKPRLPEPSVFITWPLLPSAAGKGKLTLLATVEGALRETYYPPLLSSNLISPAAVTLILVKETLVLGFTKVSTKVSASTTAAPLPAPSR